MWDGDGDGGMVGNGDRPGVSVAAAARAAALAAAEGAVAAGGGEAGGGGSRRHQGIGRPSPPNNGRTMASRENASSCPAFDNHYVP